MQVSIDLNGERKYDGGYDIIAMAAALGCTVEKCENVTGEIAVTVEARENEHVAAAKMMNYGHVAMLEKQGVKTDIDFAAMRKQLIEKPAEVKGPWQLVFTDSDSALFFISAIRHTDLLNQPKWQVWMLPDEVKEGEESHDKDQFVKHWFSRIARNYLAQLTGTSPDSDACKVLEAIRQRIGKSLDIIKTSRTRISDETKRERMIEKIKDEDKTLVPEAFEQLKSGEIDIKAFRAAVRDKKKETAAAERAAKKAASGKASKSGGAATKKLDEASQDKIAKAQAEIAAKRQAKEGGEAAAPATEG
jgi:hypothetical protein